MENGETPSNLRDEAQGSEFDITVAKHSVM